MGRHDSTQDNSSFDQIQPADLSLSSVDRTDRAAQSGDEKSGNKFWVGVLIGGLAAVALLVILLLPDHVKKPEAPALDVSQPPVSAAPPPGRPQASPWQEAQLGKQRSAAQDVLEQLLDRQFQLEEISVEQWAGESFSRAVALAGAGDEHYRNRDFTAAIAAYEEGLAIMDELLASKERVLADVIGEGNAAIAAGDAAAATAAFELALTIEPENGDALRGLQRAGVVDEVRQLLSRADELEESGDVPEALAVLQQAAGLDPADDSIGQSMERLRAVIERNEFNRHMSTGYQALGLENYDAAIAAFRAALGLDAQSSEAQEALRQAQNGRNLQAIGAHLERAGQHRRNEEWAAALREYDQAMAIDSTVLAVRESRKETQARATMDAALQDAIARPERLTTDSVWQAAKTLHRQASAIDNPGPRLRGQLTTLDQLLRDAITPVVVTFSSDNISQVMLYKVAKLGSFDTRQLELKPGNYVVVASRDGYRDVRKEFTVAPRARSMQLTIQCEERI